MRIELLPSTVGAASQQSYAQSLVINGTVAIDAGSLGYLPSLAEQKRIGHIFLSHSHLDHVASLPIFLDNVYEPGPRCPVVYAGAETIDCLKSDVFNDRLWPDFVRLSAEETPFLELVEIEPDVPIGIGDLAVTPIALQHVVPSFGFLLQDARSSVGIVCDTLPTDRVWEVLNDAPNLAAVFLEASFPSSMQWLADKAQHLTPATFQREVEKLKWDVPIFAMHIKPAFHDEIVAELAALNIARLQIAEPGRTYVF